MSSRCAGGARRLARAGVGRLRGGGPKKGAHARTSSPLSSTIPKTNITRVCLFKQLPLWRSFASLAISSSVPTTRKEQRGEEELHPPLPQSRPSPLPPPTPRIMRRHAAAALACAMLLAVSAVGEFFQL